MDVRRGITYRLSGFATALTQFLGCRDIKALSGVSRHDQYTTEKMWAMGDSAIQPSYPWPLSLVDKPTLHSVLRQQHPRYPLWYAYAEARALHLVREALVHLPMRLRIIMGRDDLANVHLTNGINLWYFGDNGHQEDGFFQIESSTEEIDPLSGVLTHAFEQAKEWAALPLLEKGDYRLASCMPSECARFLLGYLLIAGPMLNFVWVRHRTHTEPLASLWFRLGVAETLAIEHPIGTKPLSRPFPSPDSVLYPFRAHIETREL
jgi:hypothetical protein